MESSSSTIKMTGFEVFFSNYLTFMPYTRKLLFNAHYFGSLPAPGAYYQMCCITLKSYMDTYIVVYIQKIGWHHLVPIRSSPHVPELFLD